jgi:3-dehydroquinate dehydratase type I
MTEICITLREKSAGTAIERAKNCRSLGFGLVEIRVDSFEEPVWTKDDQRSIADLGLRDIITLRPGWEGGRFSGPEVRRAEFLRGVLESRPDYIDMESRMDEGTRSELLSSAADLGVRSIISYHDHRRTPPMAEMLKIMKDGFASGGDIVKLAVQCATIEDSSLLLSLAIRMKEARKRYSIMGMGPFGHLTRVLAPHIGCEMVYAKLEDPDLSDQIDARTLKRIWGALGV